MQTPHPKLTPREAHKRRFQTLLNSYIANGSQEVESELISIVESTGNTELKHEYASSLVNALRAKAKLVEAALVVEHASLGKRNAFVNFLLERGHYALAKECIELFIVAESVRRSVHITTRTSNGLVKSPPGQVVPLPVRAQPRSVLVPIPESPVDEKIREIRKLIGELFLQLIDSTRPYLQKIKRSLLDALRHD